MTIAVVTWNSLRVADVIDQHQPEVQTVNVDDVAQGSPLILRSFWGPLILDKSIRKCLPEYELTSTTGLIPVSPEQTGADPTNEIDVVVNGDLCLDLHLACRVTGHLACPLEGVAADDLAAVAGREELVDLRPGLSELVLGIRAVGHADRIAVGIVGVGFCHVAIDSLMNRAEPSAKAKFAPPGWKLDADWIGTHHQPP